MDPGVEWAVSLETPAVGNFLHLIRLTTAGAAAEAGLSTEEVEDVKIAVDELCSLLIGGANGPAHLRLRFVAVEGALVVEGAGQADGEFIIDQLARAILDATLDGLELGEDVPGGGFRLTKKRSDR